MGIPRTDPQKDDGSLFRSDSGLSVSEGRVEKMSKSKRNVVDPDDIIDQYGADTARWFVLSDSPPERDLLWTEAGIEGAWRFVQRIYRMVEEPSLPLAPVGSAVAEGLEVQRLSFVRPPIKPSRV